MTRQTEPTLHPAVLAYYDQGGETSRLSQRQGHPAEQRLEFWRTQDVLRRALPAPPARVLDVGGGTGVHAAWLRSDGYHVELVDPVPRHVAQAREQGITARAGDARRLSERDGSFDAVLLLGPLYHLPDRAERVRALAEAGRVACPGGLVAAASISRWAPIHDGLAEGYLFDSERYAPTLEATRTGHQRAEATPVFTEAYFHDPADIPGEFAEAGLAEPVVHGLEGAAWLVGGMSQRLDDPEQRAVVLRALRATEREPALLGVSAHLLTTAAVP